MLLVDFFSQGMVFKQKSAHVYLILTLHTNTHTHPVHLFLLSISSPRLRGGSSLEVGEGKDVYHGMQCPCMSHSVNMFPRLQRWCLCVWQSQVEDVWPGCLSPVLWRVTTVCTPSPASTWPADGRICGYTSCCSTCRCTDYVGIVHILKLNCLDF